MGGWATATVDSDSGATGRGGREQAEQPQRIVQQTCATLGECERSGAAIVADIATMVILPCHRAQYHRARRTIL
eukprot:915585-Alexandrium_andersonii.AAC.1